MDTVQDAPKEPSDTPSTSAKTGKYSDIPMSRTMRKATRNEKRAEYSRELPSEKRKDKSIPSQKESATGIP